MITKKEKQVILDISQKYKARKLLLFGSSADPRKFGRDIDIAVDGVAPELFFEYWGELMYTLPRPIDVIPLGGESAFQRIIQQEGQLIYG